MGVRYGKGPRVGGLVWGDPIWEWAWNGGPGIGGPIWGDWNGGPGVVKNVSNPAPG